jgi:arylsulfatase A-like enzyme
MERTMRRRDFLKVTGAAALAWPRFSPAAAARPPDIIFLMVDQQRWDALGVLNDKIKTPTYDRLARQGVLFRQATCQAPMCVPSRNALMFGLYPSQTGVLSNGSPGLDDARLPLAPLAERLHAAGYQTAGFGKTHWGHAPHGTSTRGFETRVIGGKGVEAETGARYWVEDNAQGAARYQQETASYGGGEEGVAGYIGCTSQVPEADHRDGWIAQQCLKFLDAGVDADRPLFLYLSFYKPHAGLNVPKRFEDLYDLAQIPDTPQPPWETEPGTHLAYTDLTNKSHAGRYHAWREAFSRMAPDARRRTTLRYYANCSWFDECCGQVLAKLEKLGRLQNALIVFTSDHGEMLGERQYRFTKYCLYDSSVRVPLILAGSVVPEARRGSRDERPAELVDVLPTIARVAGAPLPAGLPGLDLLGAKQHAASFCEFHDADGPAYMWRTPDWKLILFTDRCQTPGSEQLRGELYDLKSDPHEWHNLYADTTRGEIREQLKTQLLAHLMAVHARWPGNRR